MRTLDKRTVYHELVQPTQTKFKLDLAFIAIFIVFVTALTACSSGIDPRLTEQGLKERFFANKVTLNKIVEMTSQDVNVVRIAPTFTRLQNDYSWPRENIGFSSARWNEYRTMFNNAGIEGGVQVGEGVEFYVAYNCGFYYTAIAPKRTFSSHDECNRKRYKGACLVPLEKNWYMYW